MKMYYMYVRNLFSSDLKMSDNDEQLTHIETMRLFVSKQATIPKLAKNLLRLNRFLQALGELEVPFLKTIGLALTEVVSVIYKYQRKVS